MSHAKERLEKNCLNCNAQLQGRFCHICGQENVQPKETVWHLVSHFFQDITHFDGKFFNTLKLLMLHPGFLSREYMVGRRASYLNPVRMYVFTSAFFFLIFFTLFNRNNNNERVDPEKPKVNGKTLEAVEKMDSATFAAFTIGLNKEAGWPAIPMTRPRYKKFADSVLLHAGFRITGLQYKSKAEYDSLLAAGAEKDGWLKRLVKRRLLDVYDKYHNDNSRILGAFKESMLHSLPQILFVSLPLLALLLKLLYFRRKNFYYADHAIFSVHLYIFVFIALLFTFGLMEINKSLKSGFIDFASVMLFIGLFFYEYKAMRNFYQQRRAKTIIKFLLLTLSFFIVMMIIFLVFAFFSFLKI